MAGSRSWTLNGGAWMEPRSNTPPGATGSEVRWASFENAWEAEGLAVGLGLVRYVH